MFPLIFSTCLRKLVLLCNILPELICIWNHVYEIGLCAKTVLEETFLCAPNFLCALVSRQVCARPRAQLRGGHCSKGISAHATYIFTVHGQNSTNPDLYL